jgi:hypothetical protein
MRRKVGGTRKTAKRKPTTHRRRRRIGAAGSMGGLVNIIGGLGLGSIIAREGAILLGKLIPTLMSNQMIDGAVQMAVGYFLPKFAKGQFFQFVGYGIIANGVQTLAVGTGIISGPGSVMTYKIGAPLNNLRVINGTGNLRVVGAIGDNRVQNPSSSMGSPVRARSFQNYG